MLRKIMMTTIVGLILFSCNQKSHSTTTKTSGEKPASFAISFISYGTGIDYNQLTKLDSLILEKNKCNIQVEKKNWGNEGEMDYCFTSEDLNCIQEWKSLLQKQLSIKERVQLIENKNCGEGH